VFIVSSKVAEGYGQTEATAGVAITLPHESQAGGSFSQAFLLYIRDSSNLNRMHFISYQTISLFPGQVGPPLPCNLVKLIDVPEMDYYA
jgi:hypothetical protein